MSLFDFPIRGVTQAIRRFARAESGAAMLETIVIVPVIVIFAAGLFEFGALLYNKVEMETGLRDAARYLARCRDIGNPPPDDLFGCSESQAQSIAVYGTSESTPRIPGWSTDHVTFTDRYIPNPIVAGEETYNSVGDVRIIVATSALSYAGGPLLGLVGIPFIQMTARHEERYIGW